MGAGDAAAAAGLASPAGSAAAAALTRLVDEDAHLADVASAEVGEAVRAKRARGDEARASIAVAVALASWEKSTRSCTARGG